MSVKPISVATGSPFHAMYQYLQIVKKIWPLLLGHFTNDYYANSLPALIPIVLIKFDLSLGMVGLLASSFLTIGSFAQLLFGMISDRFSRFNFTLIGMGITGISFSLAGLAPSYWMLIIAVGIAGVGSAMFHPKATAETGALTPNQRGLTIALFIACGTAGFSLGPVAAALIYDTLGLEGGSFLMLAAILLVLVFLVRTIPSGKQNLAISKHMSWFSALKVLMIPWLVVVFRHAVYLSFMTYTIILLKERGISYLSSSLGLSIFLLSGVLGIMAGGPLSDRFGRRPVVVLSLLIALPNLLVFLHTEGVISFVCLIIGGFCLIMNNPVVVAYAQEKLPDHGGTASAITMGFGWGIGALMLSPIGILADYWGIVNALDLVISLLVIAIALSFLLHPQHDRPKVFVSESI
ncbi:MAG: MFS transporter [SAR324 cluster bacterium]|nr:MFS transporter [SAR324 cluster bacterium]